MSTTRYTPWGPAHTEREITTGIVRVSTSSHGGFLLDESLDKQVRGLFPHFQPFACAGAYEEDEDWAVVVIAWPYFFPDLDVYNAVMSVRASATPWKSMPRKHLRWNDIVHFIDSDREQANHLRAIVDKVCAENAQKWQTGCMSTSGHGWRVCLRRLGDGLEQVIEFASYPTRQFYTDEELDKFAIVQPIAVGGGRSSTLAVASV
jgi:hypothetical protein